MDNPKSKYRHNNSHHNLFRVNNKLKCRINSLHIRLVDLIFSNNRINSLVLKVNKAKLRFLISSKLSSPFRQLRI